MTGVPGQWPGDGSGGDRADRCQAPRLGWVRALSLEAPVLFQVVVRPPFGPTPPLFIPGWVGGVNIDVAAWG